MAKDGFEDAFSYEGDALRRAGFNASRETESDFGIVLGSDRPLVAFSGVGTLAQMMGPEAAAKYIEDDKEARRLSREDAQDWVNEQKGGVVGIFCHIDPLELE